jgi:hypothetical protein
MNPEVHPAAMLFPMMNEEELKKLAEDIEDNGLIEPVVLYHGQILDGRNRLAACELAGVLPHFTEVDGDVPSATRYVLSKNLHRRHLTINKKAMIAARSLPLLEEEARQRQGGSGRFCGSGSIGPEPIPDPGKIGRSALIAGEAIGIGTSTVKRAARVLRQDPELAERVERGELSVFAASEIVKTPKTPKDVEAEKVVCYTPATPTQIKRAEGQKQRMITALSTITGLCRGLSELNMPVALSVCAEEERTTWIERSRELAKQLRAFAAKLEETQCQQQPN